MLLRFTKMHGLGNDFIVLVLVIQHAHIQPRRSCGLCQCGMARLCQTRACAGVDMFHAVTQQFACATLECGILSFIAHVMNPLNCSRRLCTARE